MTYKVGIFNRHASCGYRGYGRTRPAAFRDAVAKASPEFLAYGGLSLEAFESAFVQMIKGTERGYTSGWLREANGVTVEFKKLESKS